MKRICIPVAVLTLAMVSNVWPATGNQYGAAIVPRNLFRLKSPEVEKPIEPPRRVRIVKLAGLTSIAGRKLAILRVEALATSGARELSLTLSEGANTEGLSVLQINIPLGTVRLNVDGEDRLLDIREDALGPSVVGPPGLALPVPAGAIPASRL